jgi:MYXO-CTERM domain-containing protein
MAMQGPPDMPEHAEDVDVSARPNPSGLSQDAGAQAKPATGRLPNCSATSVTAQGPDLPGWLGLVLLSAVLGWRRQRS